MKIAVIGATGKMGAWFCKDFLRQGHDVIGIGRNEVKLKEISQKLGIKTASSFDKRSADVDWILLAVPIDAISEMVQLIARVCPKKAIMFDILSIKGQALQKVADVCRNANIQYVSTHPMFGPGADSVVGRNFIVTPIPGFETAAAKISDFFKKQGAHVKEADAPMHDKMMAIVLNLPHFLNILFGKVLAASGFDLATIKDFGGTSFSLQEFLALNVNAEDPAIYGGLQFENKQFHNVLTQLKKFLGDYINLIEKKDVSAFSQIMKGNDEFFKQDPVYSKAYEIFYRMLKELP